MITTIKKTEETTNYELCTYLTCPYKSLLTCPYLLVPPYIIQVKILIVFKKANSNAHITQPGLITTY